MRVMHKKEAPKPVFTDTVAGAAAALTQVKARMFDPVHDCGR